jgi:hypothetical protein
MYMRDIIQFGIQEMADRLEMRKKSNHHTVLLLGTRAGRLFHSTHIYESLQKLSSRNFHQLSRIQQFQECYTLLTSDKFSETDLHSILHTSLKDLHVSETDACLASLIKQEYFDEIISTNIDDMLEEALLQIDLKESRDYDVTRIGRSLPHYEKSHSYRIIKLFGDFLSRDYTIRERSAHFEEQSRKIFLQNLLEKDLLLIGIDLAWDQDILRLIPPKASGTVWFVSEEDDIVDKSSFLANILRARHAIQILGHEGNYDHFVRKVHHCLLGNVPFAHAQALQHIQHRVDQIARIIELLPAITEQLTILNARLSGIDHISDQLQLLHNQNQNILGELQKIQKHSKEIEK